MKKIITITILLTICAFTLISCNQKATEPSVYGYGDNLIGTWAVGEYIIEFVENGTVITTEYDNRYDEYDYNYLAKWYVSEDGMLIISDYEDGGISAINSYKIEKDSLTLFNYSNGEEETKELTRFDGSTSDYMKNN